MLAIEQARRHLEHLGLTQAATILDGRLDVAAKKQVPYADFLADLLRFEVAARRERLSAHPDAACTPALPADLGAV